MVFNNVIIRTNETLFIWFSGNKKEEVTKHLSLQCTSSSNSTCQELQKPSAERVLQKPARDYKRKDKEPVVFIQFKNRLVQYQSTHTPTPNSGIKLRLKVW